MYRNNGEYWYRDQRGVFSRLLGWFIHIGGWQMPHWTTEGYSYRWIARHAARLALRAHRDRSRMFALYSSACPISLFGHRITLHHFGINWSGRRAYYCLHYEQGRGWYAYRSHDATPRGADTWYIGAPKDVVRAAQAQHERMDAWRREREDRERAAPLGWRRG